MEQNNLENEFRNIDMEEFFTKAVDYIRWNGFECLKTSYRDYLQSVKVAVRDILRDKFTTLNINVRVYDHPYHCNDTNSSTFGYIIVDFLDSYRTTCRITYTIGVGDKFELGSMRNTLNTSTVNINKIIMNNLNEKLKELNTEYVQYLKILKLLVI